MHIVIYGLGAIGGFYGLSLAKYLKDHSELQSRISFVARGKTYETLKHFGGKLICKKNTLGEMQESIIIENNFDLCANYSEVKINPDDNTLVLLCVKSKDTVSACEDIKKQLTQNTAVISVQNGVENEKRIARVLGAKHTIGSLTSIAAETLEPGIYLQKGDYGFIIGELEENKTIQWAGQARIQYIYKFFKNAGLCMTLSENIYKDLWFKITWNAAFNPASVLYESTIGPLLADSVKKSLIEGIVLETAAVAKAEGYDLGDNVVEKQIARTSGPIWYDFRTSMLQDFQKGRPIELDDLLGVIVRKAKEHGIPAPNASRIYDELLAKLEPSSSLRA